MADAQTPVLTDDEIAAAVAPIYGNRVAATMGLSDDIRTARLIERAVLDKLAAQAPAQQAEAVAVTTEAELRKLRGSCVGSKLATVFHPDAPGFGVKLYTHPAPSQPGRAVMQQALDALRKARWDSLNMPRSDMLEIQAAIAALSATMEKPNGS